MKISIKFLKKFGVILSKCIKEEEKEILKKNYLEGFSNLSFLLKRLSPIKKDIKEKYLLLCLNLEEYKNTIVPNLNDEILGFMKTDHRLLLSIAKFKPDKSFQDELVQT